MKNVYLENATDDDFCQLIGQEISSIKTNGCNSAITDLGLKYISQIKGLEELDLEWATQITDSGVKELSKLNSLRYIDLSFCNNVSDEAIDELSAANNRLNIEQ